MYERDEIIINPDFQRLYRWTDYQKTRFIESVIIGIPIPPIFVAEDSQGRWEVVDGLQRLSTIFSFFGILKNMPEKNNWILGAGDMIQTLDGFTCDTLPLKIQLNIKRSSFRIEIIKWNSQYDLRFELFNRLNTGGTPLTNQEIRNSLYRSISSKFNDYLKELSAYQNFVDVVDIPKEKIDQLYLEELVLRFMSLYRNRQHVSKSIALHMTDFMKQCVEDDNFKYDQYSQIFKKTFDILRGVGTGIFNSANREFSTAIYDTTTIGIAENIHLYSVRKPIVIKDKINEVKSDEVYQKMVRSGGNNSVQRVKKRLEFANSIFGKI
ncbi:MAG: DUF262 domain-containing protein [Prevotella sp.]|nr:DUF262 domain-containing protein [Prevotella sp.]